jgi:hypothetical protein
MSILAGVFMVVLGVLIVWAIGSFLNRHARR